MTPKNPHPKTNESISYKESQRCHTLAQFDTGATEDRTISPEDLFKQQLLAVARDHRAHCLGEDCPIQLICLLEIGNRIGLHFTTQEQAVFF